MSRPYRRIWNTLVSGIDKTLGRTRVAARPLRIHIEVNDYCNLKCPYCPRENPLIPKDTGNIPLEAIERLEPWIRRANYVGLAGNGEPFMHPKIMEILRIVTRAGAVPSVITNGTRFRPAYIEELPTLGPLLLMISVDGGTKATFERWRRGADFDKVRESLRALKVRREQLGTPYPVVNFIVCLMQENIGETEQIVDVAAEAGAAVIVFQTMYPYVKELEYLRVLDLSRVDEAVEKARRRAAAHGIRIDYTPMSFDIDYREGTTSDPSVGTVGNLEKRHFEETRRAEEAKRQKPEAEGKTPGEACESSGMCAVPGRPGDAGGDASIVAPERRPSRMETPPARSANGAVYHCENIWHQMHVTLKGDVRPCCFWTDGVVGNIADAPLESLWNGPEWDRIRGAIHSGLKPISCKGCHWLVRHDKKKIWRDTWTEIRNLLRDRR